MKKPFLALILILFLVKPMSAFCVESKSLYLTQDNIYLLLFDDKIQEFETSKEDVLKVSLMTTIFNDKHQVILQPKKDENVNIIFWTQDEVFNFDVFVNKELESEKIINVSSAQKKEIEKISNEVGFEIDTPPGIKNEMEGFKIDLPPGYKESE